MTVLVTGATGFLGRYVVAALQRAHIPVRALGRNAAACAALQEAGVDVVRADLRDRAAVIAACASCRAVLHTGALSAPWGQRAEFVAINVGGTANVIEGCRVQRVPRLVYVSSPSVIFTGRDHTLLTEDAPYPQRFASVYSHTKKMGEDLVRVAQVNGLETIILRPKALFGPGDPSLLPRIIAAARAGRLPQIGDGTNRVDLTFVENVAHALVLALDSQRAVGGVYTITNNEHPRLWDVIRNVLERLHIPAKLRAVPLPIASAAAGLMELRALFTGQEPLLTRYTVAVLGRIQTYDISAAERDLGYHPIVPLATAIERTIAALQQEQTDCVTSPAI